jgi:hypothetical protein
VQESSLWESMHRRRTVIVRTTEAGEVLEAVRIVNDVQRLASVMARADDCPEVVLEATYGWYWAVDALQAGGANVHLAHPLGVKAFEYRRVKKMLAMPRTWRTCCGWDACPRRGSLPRPPESCVISCGTAPSSSGCVRTAKPKSTPCWPSAGSRC